MKSDTTNGICSQDAVEAIGNRYDLVLIASQRVRELSQGHTPRVISSNGPLITAMMEVAAGKVGRDYLNKVNNRKSKRGRN